MEDIMKCGLLASITIRAAAVAVTIITNLSIVSALFAADSNIDNFVNRQGGCEFIKHGWEQQFWRQGGLAFGKRHVEWTPNDYAQIRSWVIRCLVAIPGKQEKRLQQDISNLDGKLRSIQRTQQNSLLVAAEAQQRQLADQTQKSTENARYAKAVETEASEKIAQTKRLAEAKEAGEEAAKAAAAEVRIAVRQKGVEYAKSSGTNWKVARVKDDMMDRFNVTAVSMQTNGKGAFAHVEGSCEKMGIVFNALIVDEGGKPSVTVAGQAALPGGAIGVKTRYRVNDAEPLENIIQQLEYSNKFRVVVLHTRLPANEAMAELMVLQSLAFGLSGSNIVRPLEETWRVMTELTTSRGPILVKIPLYDDAVQEVIQTCK
jgi:hypothetical protein